ncbi:MAG: phosphonoacetaldehyde hydrolase [Pirellulales bacterium]
MSLATSASGRPLSLRAVIFDWAGTTVDYGSLAPVRAVMEAFRTEDVPISMAEARGPMGMAKRDHLRTLLRDPGIAARWQKVHGQLAGEADVDRIYANFLPLQMRLLADHAGLIPGCLETVAALRARGLRIGSTTGYTRELMDVLEPLAAQQGFAPEATITASDVNPGRPAPWMCLECARRLDVFPPASIVVVDDTAVGIEAGRNAGMWAVAVVQSGNLVGLTLEEFHQLPPAEQNARRDAARQQLLAAGAHYAINSVADLLAILPQIDEHLASGGTCP